MERFTLSDGVEINLVRGGDPDADVTVVLLHSYAADHRIWHKVVDLLPAASEQSVAVVAYDHRGHGDSDPADAATATVDQLGDDLADVLERAIPHGRIVLVGHGMGGLVAMSMIARHRLLLDARVGALMFLATSVGWVAETLPRPLGHLVQDLHAILGPRIVAQVREKIDKATSIGLRWLLLGDDPQPDDVRLVAEMVSRHWPDTVALFRTALDRYDRATALKVAAGIPVVAIVGEKDRLVPSSHAKALASAVRLGHAVIVPGCGHMVPLEASAEVVPRIVGLVREARSGEH